MWTGWSQASTEAIIEIVGTLPIVFPFQLTSPGAADRPPGQKIERHRKNRSQGTLTEASFPIAVAIRQRIEL